MKYLILFPIFTILPVSSFAKEISVQKADPAISIQEIKDRSASGRGDSCGFFGIWSTPGEAARELLTEELHNAGGITILEREHIATIYQDEFSQENLDTSTVAAKKKFVAAKYAVAGVVSEFEWCLSGQNQGIDIGGLLGIGELSVKHQTSKAHVAFDLRLIDVKTGTILKTFKSAGQVDDSGLELGADLFGVRITKESFEKTPLGKATRIAISDAASRIAAEIKKIN